MLLAVSIGLEQSPRCALFKRRWIRRLLLVSLRRMIAFTRNPLARSVLEKPDTPLNTRKAEGFRDFHNTPPPKVGPFACLRARSSLARPRAWAKVKQPPGASRGRNRW